MIHANAAVPGGAATGEADTRGPHEPPAAEPVVVERPAHAPTVQLVGEMAGTSFKEQQWLIQRDGRFMQVTGLVYRVIEQANGQHTLEEIAARVTDSTDWEVTAADVERLIRAKLIPLGLIATADGPDRSPAAADARPRSPLTVNLRLAVIGPRVIEPLAGVLQGLFAPPILIPTLVAIALAHGWLYAVHGAGDSIREAFYTPGRLLAVLALVLLAAVIHEFGHAAALHYGGGRARRMGAGFYLIYPAFYTDTTESYRLGRWARVRTDLGGIYFHLLFALGLVIAFQVTAEESLLFAVMLINLGILYELIPFVRLDGYWVFTDLVGVPDLFSQMRPFLRSMLRGASLRGDRLPELRRWAKVAFAAYIALTVPILAGLLLLLITRLPGILLATWDAELLQTRHFGVALDERNIPALMLVVTQMLLLALPTFGIGYIVYGIAHPGIRAAWEWSRPTPLRRAAGTLGTAATIGVLALFWAPQLAFLTVPAPAGVRSVELTGRAHVLTPVSYPQTPPVGGDHAPVWQNCGFYDAPIANEHAVHSLEHGAVWITYRPDVPREHVDRLRELARRQPYVLVSPNPDLPAPVVASAWGRQLTLDSPEDSRLELFVRAFRLGRQAPERGGPCTGGVGATMVAKSSAAKLPAP